MPNSKVKSRAIKGSTLDQDSATSAGSTSPVVVTRDNRTPQSATSSESTAVVAQDEAEQARLKLVENSPLLSTSNISLAASRLSQTGSIADPVAKKIASNQPQAIQQNQAENSGSERYRSSGDTCCFTACCCYSCIGGSSSNSTMPKQINLILALFLAELIGTFILVLIGDGTIAAHVVTKQNVNMLTCCFGFGVGAMIASFASAKISGAHLNPAATVAFALDGKLSWALVPVYLCAQYLGGFLAALVLFVNYKDAINAIDSDGQHLPNTTGMIFATYPGPWLTSLWPALLDQALGTAILIFAICAISDKQNSGLEERHQPLIVAFIIGFVCVAFSPNCGAIFNPARDLSPRLLTWVMGYSRVWEPLGFYWLVAGVVGPHLGAILGLFGYKLLIGCGLDKKRRLEELSASNQQPQLQQSFKFTDGMQNTNYGSGYAMR